MVKLFFIFLFSVSIHIELQAKLDKSLYSEEITPEAWKEVNRYLMDATHPLKEILDLIFATRRVLKSVESLEKAGFKILFQRSNGGLVVVKHPWLKGYLIKLYLDSSSRKEWPLWALRAKGARKIQKLINKYEYHQFLKVPQKWIYPVTKHRRPLRSENVFPKDFVLVVTDMRLSRPETSLARYKSGVTRAHLRAIYQLIIEGGLSDSHIGNIPLSRDGRTAFIDTEYVNSWPVHLDWLTEYFSSLNQQYWLWLIDQEAGEQVEDVLQLTCP